MFRGHPFRCFLVVWTEKKNSICVVVVFFFFLINAVRRKRNLVYSSTKFGLAAPSVNFEACRGVWRHMILLAGLAEVTGPLPLTDGGMLRGSVAHPPSALADKWPHYGSAGHVFLIHRTEWWRLAPRGTSAFELCQVFWLSESFSLLGWWLTISFKDNQYQAEILTLHRNTSRYLMSLYQQLVRTFKDQVFLTCYCVSLFYSC